MSKSKLTIILLFLLSFALVFQSAPPPQAKPTQPITQLIVNVQDSKGRYVGGLTANDFVVEENGVRQEVASFTPDSEIPLSIGILIDKSASMRLPLAAQGKEKVSAALLAADGAARVLVKLMKPQDEFLFMVFDDGMQVKQKFTEDQKKVTEMLNKNNLVGGSTHLYSAVVDALKQMKTAKNRRRALVVITDVHDTSGQKPDEMKNALHGAEVPVYTFGMRWDAWGLPGEEPGQPTFEVAVLREMAAESGGRSMVVDIPDLTSDYTVTQMIGFVQQIAAELRGQYTLRYYSTLTVPDAEKAIRIRAFSPELQVRFRRESAAPAKPPAKK